MSNKTENDELGVQRKIHSGLVKQLCAPTLNMNKRLNNKMPEKKKNRKMIYELSQLLRWRHPVHYTPKSFSWSSHSSFKKVTKAVSILTLQNKEWKTNLHSTRRLYRFSLMLHDLHPVKTKTMDVTQWQDKWSHTRFLCAPAAEARRASLACELQNSRWNVGGGGRG